MTTNPKIVKVLAGSPEDVADERRILLEVEDEINRTIGRQHGVRVDIYTGERDALPGFAEDAQAVISDQFPKDYDVFIGIFWNRLGTPTGRAESGTVEEFNSAKKRYDQDPDSVRIMLYFKDALPSKMSDIDTSQLEKVRKFKESVGKEGLYAEFNSTEDFATKVRIHLTQFILDRFTNNEVSTQPNEKEEDESAPECRSTDLVEVGAVADIDLLDDEGLLDLEDTFEEEMHELTEVVRRMSSAIEDVGTDMTRRTEELQTLPGYGVENLSYQQRQRLRVGVKRGLRNASDDMNDFVKRMRVELPLYRQHLDQGLSTLLKAVPMYLEIYDEDTTQELKGIVTRLLGSIDGMLESMEGFHDSISDLPRMTAVMVRSQREAKKVVQEVIDISRGGKASLNAAMELLP